MAAAYDGGSREIQLYPEKTPLISAFWRDKYEKDARKYWDLFYKRNANRFFKDRHYLDKEWGKYFESMSKVVDGAVLYGIQILAQGFDADISVAETASLPSEQEKVILEVGCGTGNTIYPLIAKYPKMYVYACDFSPRAVDLVKAHDDYDESRVKAFVCDVTSDPLSQTILQASVDVITLIFVLSAIAPEKMPGVISNLKSILKPGGCILLRDYAIGDLAQERFTIKDQTISENFYVRGDGTRAYYFAEDMLRALFLEQGFQCKEMKLHCRQLENRSRKVVMDRRWIQSVFYLPEQDSVSGDEKMTDRLASPSSPRILRADPGAKAFEPNTGISVPTDAEYGNELVVADIVVGDDKLSNLSATEDLIVDLSAAELFGGSPVPEPLEVVVGSHTIHATCLPREFQHTYPATGLMLWESASAFAELLAANPHVAAGKTVLELGCGSVGLCSLITSASAVKVVATDGDKDALGLLQKNLNLNKESAAFAVDSISCRELKWGCKAHGEGVRAANGGSGFDLIIGTDVTYVEEAVPLLFESARALLIEPCEACPVPLLILCYRLRRVTESDILSAAVSHGFHVTGLWTSGGSSPPSSNSGNLGGKEERLFVESLFREGLGDVSANYSALQILCLSPDVRT